MISQLIKLIWKQRRYNSLLIVEIALSFIVLVALSATCVHYWKLYNEPLGVDYKNVWILDIKQASNTPPNLVLSDSVKNIKLDQMKNFIKIYYPEVLFSSKITRNDYPYSNWMSNDSKSYNKKEVSYNVSLTEPDFVKTFNMKLLEGRWINEEDKLSNIKVVVINMKLKEEWFGNKSVSGKTITVEDREKKSSSLKIVGVFEALKQLGEFEQEPCFMLDAYRENGNPYSGIAIKLKPDISKDFEARLIKYLSSQNRTYTFRVEKMEELRSQYIISQLAPLIIIGSIVLFLIVNVMLGLFGMLWLNTSRRKSEIGLRMAVGSSSGKVLWQLLSETYCLALLAITIGLVFTSQMFIFNIYNVPAVTLVEANLAAMFLILLFCTISAYAPGKLAAGLQPAEALHEE